MSVKREIIIIIVGIAVLGVLGFVGIKYIPAMKVAENKEVTENKKVAETKSLLLAGKLSILSGKIIGVKAGAVTIKISTQGDPRNGQEEEMMFAADAVVRKIVPADVIPAEGELVPAKTAIVPVSELKVGDDLVVYLAEDGKIKMADLMPGVDR